MPGGEDMTISEVSKKYGISQDTLRYYERVGVLPPIHRTKGGLRDFTQEDCGWVELAGCMRSAGLPIEYRQCAMEDIDFPAGSFDIVLSSLAFHYLESFSPIAEKVSRLLAPGGSFVFSVEHPVFTAYGSQDWYYGDKGEILHFPVDRYFYEGRREAVFLGEEVVKYHRTLTTYVKDLLGSGFQIRDLAEPMPPADLLETVPGMKDELRRPMMLLIAAEKI